MIRFLNMQFFLLHLVGFLTVEAIPHNVRIVGGQEVNDEIVPFIVSLMHKGNHQCGGSILNARTIITAAHCLDTRLPGNLTIHVGDKTLTLKNGKIFEVEATHWHPQYIRRKHNNDIGLVRLKGKLQFNERVQPIPLIAANAELTDGSLATVYGWGTTSFGSKEISEVLRYVQVPLVNLQRCKTLYVRDVTDNMLCAGREEGKVDACSNDSGGPLEQNGRLIGVVSWGQGCGWKGYPGVYTDVRRYVSWVNETLKREYGERV